MPDPIARLIAGFHSFHGSYFEGRSDLYRRLAAQGQQPQVLVVACSDSRVDPALLTHSRPGDLFIVRNVAAIVPPYQADGRHHGTSAAIEFAVRGLKVEHIVVLGHALCGGVRALAEPVQVADRFEFLSDWVTIAAPARAAVARYLAGSPPERSREGLEQATLLVSLRNLLSFPWIEAAMRERRLTIHGWYFDLVGGLLLAHDVACGRFVPVELARPAACTAPAGAPPQCACVGHYDFERCLLPPEATSPIHY